MQDRKSIYVKDIKLSFRGLRNIAYMVAVEALTKFAGQPLSKINLREVEDFSREWLMEHTQYYR